MCLWIFILMFVLFMYCPHSWLYFRREAVDEFSAELDSYLMHPLHRELVTRGKGRSQLVRLLDFCTSYPLFCFTVDSFLLSVILCFNVLHFISLFYPCMHEYCASAWATYFLYSPLCGVFFLDFYDSTLFCLVALLD